MSSYSQLEFCAMSASVSQCLDGCLSVWLSNWIFCRHQVELDLELFATVSPRIQLLDCQFFAAYISVIRLFKASSASPYT